MISKIILQFKSIIRKSSSGNFAIITAFLIPFILCAVGISIDVARIMYHKNFLQLSSDEALEQGLDTLISNNKYTTETIKIFIKNDLKSRLINDFNDKQATDIVNRAQITIEETSTEYIAKLISSYNMPVNPFSAINLPKDRSVLLKIISTLTRPAKKNDTFIVMANIQAWKLSDGEDNKVQWIKNNKLVINSINNTIGKNKNILFSDIIGNYTNQLKPYQVYFARITYDNLKDPHYIGLGARDFGYGVKFQDKDTENKTVAAIMWEFLGYLKKASNYDLIETDFDGIRHFKGTAECAWDYKDLHFIQIQNHPFFTDSRKSSHFETYIPASITDTGPSLWLQNDLKTAAQNNKKIFLTMYDADSSSVINAATTKQKQYMRELIQKYKIKAIFSGSANQVQESFESSLYNSVRIYNAGATYKGDYLVLERINDNTLSVTAYNGASGNPVVVKKMSDINLQ
ncbi:TadE/TadG family type IV pilus assembly protein [Liberibacter crescens]|uniref:TadE/TadG family type IV pilus assembly protein n=1 Tax=Liberibacter crescens TaxID=1273132 RepID=UPI000762F261|nr:TadE/TadG family type IV pilus assembly protein [Liberibacter crescens]AMC12572.1 hypothetical protein RL73_02115 [Liberibacter crescens]